VNEAHESGLFAVGDLEVAEFTHYTLIRKGFDVLWLKPQEWFELKQNIIDEYLAGV